MFQRVLTQQTTRTFIRQKQQSFLTSYFGGSTTLLEKNLRNFSSSNDWHGTTIICVRKDNQICMMGDGQVSMGNMTVKPNAKKIRRILPKGGNASSSSSSSSSDKESEDEQPKGIALVGFAGSTADAFTLLDRLEGKLDEHPGQLTRSCVELAKGWRTDKYLRRLEASLLVADDSGCALELTGNGDVLESADGILSVGSGSPFALAAARALIDVDGLTAKDIATKAMNIASDMCVYTNKEYMCETLDNIPSKEEDASDKEK